MGGLLSLFSKDRALIDTVDSKNAAARGVVYDPSRGIRDIMYYPQSTLIAGGHPTERMVAASAVIKYYAQNRPVLFLNNGGGLYRNLCHSDFAMARGGVVTLPADPISSYASKREAVFAIERFAESSGTPLSGKAYDCLEFMIDGLGKLGHPLNLRSLDELFSNPPAKVLFTLFAEGLISQDEFDAETERFQLFMDDFAGAKRVVSLMASLFSQGSDREVMINDLIDGNRILSVDLSLTTKRSELATETLLEIYLEALRRRGQNAILIAEEISMGRYAFLDSLLTDNSSGLTKILLCQDINSLGRNDDEMKAVWNRYPNRVILWHENAEALSGLLGTYTMQTVSTHFGETQSSFGLFPSRSASMTVAPQPGIRRIPPEEIRSLGDRECFIQTSVMPEIIKTILCI